MIQDDDAAPKKPTWVTHAVSLFNKYPRLGALGGGVIENKHLTDVDSPPPPPRPPPPSLLRGY
jgi:hypothetical protein